MATEEIPGPTRSRVKVYELRDSDWYDRGTGYVEVTAIKQQGAILVAAEDKPGESLLDVQIKRDEFMKQQETLIVWTDARGTDLALSFQEPEGCQDVYNALIDFQSPDGQN